MLTFTNSHSAMLQTSQLNTPVLTCHFWNVGQGLFSSGKIETNNGEPFVWVYDCGSTSKSKNKKQNYNISLLRKAIAKMDNEYSASVIDLMAVSHFDKDHINGLDLLLHNKQVKRWLLPYYPLWQRLIIAYLHKIQPEDEIFKFYINPIGYLSQKYQIEEFLLVLPSDEDKNIEDVYQEVNTLTEEKPLQSNITIFSSFNISEIEFVPYCVPFSFINLNNVNTSSLSNSVDNILNSNALIKDKIAKIKSIYYQYLNLTSAKKKRQRNLISLHLYIAPIQNTLFIKGIFTHQNINKFLFTNNQWNTQVNNNLIKSAILYCGDGSLKTKKQIAQINQDLGIARMQNIYCLQVPHHGSADNWKVGLANDLQPNISIFCADPNKSYVHPRPQVFFDLKDYNPILVDDKNDFSLTLS